jgi:hypothetical protein
VAGFRRRLKVDLGFGTVSSDSWGIAEGACNLWRLGPVQAAFGGGVVGFALFQKAERSEMDTRFHHTLIKEKNNGLEPC